MKLVQTQSNLNIDLNVILLIAWTNFPCHISIKKSNIHIIQFLFFKIYSLFGVKMWFKTLSWTYYLNSFDEAQPGNVM